MSTSSTSPPENNRRSSGKFLRGRSGNPAGRPTGIPNKATVEAKAVCAQLLGDPAYRARLRARLIAGKLAPAVECMLWHYAHGKPKEERDHNHTINLAQILNGDFSDDD